MKLPSGSINHALRFNCPADPRGLYLARLSLRLYPHSTPILAYGAAIPPQIELCYLRILG